MSSATTEATTVQAGSQEGQQASQAVTAESAISMSAAAAAPSDPLLSQPASSIQAALDNVQYPTNALPSATGADGLQHVQQQQPEASTSRLNNPPDVAPDSMESQGVVAPVAVAAAAPSSTIAPTPATAPTVQVDSGASGENKDDSQEKKEQREVHQGGAVSAGEAGQDEVKLDLLLLSGSRKRFNFKPTTTVNEVLAWVYKDWPSEWQEQKPSELGQLRLLHRGQFLQGPTSLASHNLEIGESTVMHLNIKPSETSDNLKPKRTKTPSHKAADDSHGGGCCSGCIIS